MVLLSLALADFLWGLWGIQSKVQGKGLNKLAQWPTNGDDFGWSNDHTSTDLHIKEWG